jgi:hypothetical protein
VSYAKDQRLPVWRPFYGKETLIDRVGHHPRFSREISDCVLGVTCDANYSIAPWNGESLKSSRQPFERKRSRAIDCRDETHISMNRDYVRKTGEDCADRAVALRSLAVNNIWSQLAQKISRGADATLIASAKPTDFWYNKTVEPNVVGKFMRRSHALLRAADDMNFRFRHGCEPLKQCLGRRAKVRLR